VEDPLTVVLAFGAACNAHDLDAALGLCADDVVFDGTTPPDGLKSLATWNLVSQVLEQFVDADRARVRAVVSQPRKINRH